MTRKLLSIFSLIVVCSTASAQDYAFKVLANKGSNEYKSGDSWQPVKTGLSLKPEDELRLVDNAYMGLVHITGKPMELKQSGSFKVAELASKVSGGGSSVLNKYTDFILSSNSPEAKKNKLSATGAVVRDVTNAPIKLMLPPNQNSGIFSNATIVSWEDADSKGPYVVTFRNMFDDVLSKVETPETSLRVDLGNPKFASENAILVEVRSKSDPKIVSQQHLIKKLTPADQERVKKSLNEIATNVSDETALNKLILAGFYEENNLILDAIAAYNEAIQLAPDVPYFQEIYEEFQFRHGLRN